MPLERARAKLNLALHVRSRRPDGYHELETLFAFVALGDAVRVEPSERPAFTVSGPFAAALAHEKDNLVTRAERSFADAFNIDACHAIALDKQLPVASGMGGGSADAAATLRALATLHGVPLGSSRLMACADALGSDVPACLVGVTALGRGRGERLDPLPGLPALPVLLVNPRVAVPTHEVFRRWDGVDRGPLEPAAPLEMALAGRNDLEPPARAIAPVIDDVLALLAAQEGVALARMSGSGATCFALFLEMRDCAAAARAVQATAPDWWCAQTELV